MKQKYTLDFFKSLALGKDGICLSEDYQNTSSVLDMRCHKGHNWSTKASALIKGHWCHICPKDKTRSTIDEMQIFASKKRGYVYP